MPPSCQPEAGDGLDDLSRTRPTPCSPVSRQQVARWPSRPGRPAGAPGRGPGDLPPQLCFCCAQLTCPARAPARWARGRLSRGASGAAQMQPRACRGEADLGAWQVSLPGVSPCARPRVGVLRGQHLLTGSEQTSCRPGPEGPLSRPTSSVPLRTRSGAGSGAQGVCSQRCRARPRRPRVRHAPSPCVGPSRGLWEVQGPSSGGADHTQGRAQSRAQGHRVPRGPGARPPPRTSIPHSPAPARSCLGPGRRESPAPVPSVCRVCPKQGLRAGAWGLLPKPRNRAPGPLRLGWMDARPSPPVLGDPAVREGQLVGGEWGREEAGRWPQPSPAHRAHRGC